MDDTAQGFKVPYMYMLSTDDPKEIDAAFGSISTNAYYFLRFTGFEHGNFCDCPLWENNNLIIGSIDRVRSVNIVRAYVLAFFNHFLKGEQEPLMDGLSTDYPEVKGVIQAQ